MSTMKPSRSDEVTNLEEQIKNSNQIRADFDSLAPKRPTKPTRSEPGAPGSFSTSDETTDHPEADKFRSLQSQTHGQVLGEGDSSAVDEFLETEYYTNLTAIDKQHHTTGSGFINVVKEDGGGETEAVTAAAIGDGGEKAVYRSNPATNEWIPAASEEDLVSESSFKPNRSESS
ncbi:hypothetical protein CARUB_v10005877mg [Capsella rubella]|uniref:Maternal effect embryo arrest 59 n=1 Tax=Capsella rubella TaxID=81985 RepID=R0F6T9_9BRAS|nr:uncharacterized protein LOC17880525 [Capsella rubella]EOA17532.1 hypothetical protein CARUB_v10005877mg [Capsella rubella]